VPKHGSVEQQLEPHLPGRPLQKRIERRGLRPRYAAYLIIASWSVGVVVFGIVERLVDPGTFDNVWLGMWWAIQTVTTVGYGDVVPGSTAGKVIGSFLMLGGLSLFAVVTGAITSAFVAERQREGRAQGDDSLTRRLDEMTAKLDAMQADIARLDRRAD
jgi:ABC-type phosphate transport system permease subunit